jgi:hypothetical protein
MFDQRNDPVHLLHSLKTFLRVWHDDLQDWYGIAPEKLAATPLPDPLRRLYTFAGNGPGENFWCSPFAHQDYLLPFELLYQSEDRLHFAGENQGCWTCCTALEGDDPPVWFREGNENWQLLEDTLAQFLVTLCLHETVFGAACKGSGTNLNQRFRDAGRHVAPLWLNGAYPPPIRHHSFHYAGQVLIMDDTWCATNNSEIAESLPDLFKPLTQTSTEFVGKPLWEFPEIPLMIRQNMLRMQARKHQEQADFHAQRAAGFRQLEEKLGD